MDNVRAMKKVLCWRRALPLCVCGCVCMCVKGIASKVGRIRAGEGRAERGASLSGKEAGVGGGKKKPKRTFPCACVSQPRFNHTLPTRKRCSSRFKATSRCGREWWWKAGRWCREDDPRHGPFVADARARLPKIGQKRAEKGEKRREKRKKKDTRNTPPPPPPNTDASQLTRQSGSGEP